jgi:hypothetical protein
MANDKCKDISMEIATLNSPRFSYFIAIFTAIIAIVTFGFAMIAVPISGSNCMVNCSTYPYLETASRFPRDFLWMPFAIILVIAYVILMVVIHDYAPIKKRIFSQIGLSFAIIAAVILITDYFTQFSIIPVSLRNNETLGLAMLIQYNPHGLFIAMEEIGYLIMSLSFLLIAPVFAGKSRLESAVRWLFATNFILAIVSLVVISFIFGLDRQDRFEVIVISINWLVLLLNGILIGRHFKKQQKLNEDNLQNR